MTRRSIKLWLSVWALCVVSCSSDLIRNPNVERWCGSLPCDWMVDGEVERVSTWHPNDYAISLLSDDATLIQENATIDELHDCLDFALVAKIDRDVRVFLELDFLADGTVEFSQRLPESDWERRTFRVTPPDWYRKLRFIIRKDGPGRAILAEITARTAYMECTAPAIELLNRPPGALCTSDEECGEGHGCTSGRCNACESDETCADDQLCALQDVGNSRYRTCVGHASTPLGAACDRDQQCGTGVCAEGACSECASDAECQEGERCALALGRPAKSRYWPKLCAAGQRLRENGLTCTDASDCQSSDCDGFMVSCGPDLSCRVDDPFCVSCGPELQLGVCR